MTDAALRHRIRVGGPWQVLLPGVYLSSTGSPTSTQRKMAALLYAGREAAISGPAAVAWHGIRVQATDLVDVLVPLRCKRRDAEFVRLHPTSAMPAMIFPDGEIRYVPPARAVADTARMLRRAEDVSAVVASAIQRGKVQVWQLAEELDRGSIRGSARFRQAMAEVADGVRSVAEANLWSLIKREHLPIPMFNPRLYVGAEFLATPDAWWPQAAVAAEVDSREWHLSPRDWERTLERHSRMSACGIIVLHYTPKRLRTEPRAVAAEIRATLEVGRGRRLPQVRTLPAREGLPPGKDCRPGRTAAREGLPPGKDCRPGRMADREGQLTGKDC
jgi:very-short-patch-repair endonuclease